MKRNLYQVIIAYLLISSALLFVKQCKTFAQELNQTLKAKIEIQNMEKLEQNYDSKTNTITKEIPFSINLDGTNSLHPPKEKINFKWIYPDGKIIDSKNPRSYRFENHGNYTIELTITDSNGNSDTTFIKIIAEEKTKTSKKDTKKKSSKNFSNGDLSEQIVLNEIFPNPKGADKNNEFIELFNSSKKDVNLGNWKIIQISAQNKVSETILSDQMIIKANSVFTIKKFKQALRNSQNTISLVDFQGKLIDKIQYEKTQEDLSLSKISLKNTLTGKVKESSSWNKPTPDKKNPTFYLVEGTIVEIAAKTSNHQITLELTNSQKQIELNYELKINPTLAKITLKEGKKVQAIVSKENQTFEVQKLKIMNEKPKQEINSKSKEARKKTELTIAIIILSLATNTLYRKPLAFMAL